MRKNPITLEQVQTVYRKSKNLRDLLITGIVNPKPTQKVRCIRYWEKHPRNPVAQHFRTKNLNEKEYTLEILDQEHDKNKRN